MSLPRCVATVFGVVWLTAIAIAAQPAPVSPLEAGEWVRFTIPLPKQIEITGKLQVPADQVAVTAADAAAPLVQQAARELRETVGGPANSQTVPAANRTAAESRISRSAERPSAAFELRLELGGPEAERLKALPNSDQAYLIEPMQNQRGLRLVALRPRGLYYAAKTLQQLIRAKARDGRLEMPLVRVTDWPDLADRGLWGGDSSEQLRWMADRKMNYDEQISGTRVAADKTCSVHYPPFKQRMIDEGPTYGVEPVPVILHLEQLSGSGLFKAYPELIAQGGKPGTVCYSNPLFVDVLAKWMLLWREKPGVTQIDVWMAENLGGQAGCQCAKCKGQDRNLLEARTIVAAWRKARLTEKDLGLRVLTSEQTEKSNPQILAELPPEVKVWYYHSLLTYNSSHRRMVKPYLEEAARQGRWIGVCANIDPLVGFWTPMSSAPFIRFRMNEFVDKKLSGLLGYAVPRVAYCQFNTEAAAEWAWNAKGRSAHEFALSWAVRRGYKDPEKFAEWSDVMGPVSWDVYGSEFPSGEKRNHPGKMADLLKAGKLPGLGEVLWGIYGIPFADFRKPEQIDRDLADAEKGVRLAGELGIPEFLHESRVIHGYMQAIKALWELKQVASEGIAAAERAKAQKFFQMYLVGLNEAREALPAWEESLPMKAPGDHLVREKPLPLLEEMIRDMRAVAADFGIQMQ